MRVRKLVLIPVAAVCVAAAWGQSGARQPSIGYLYPAGGRQGTVCRIQAGGQHLRSVNGVYFSGEGVRGSVVEHVRPINGGQLGDIAKHLRALAKQRVAELRMEAGAPAKPDEPAKEELPELPDHPLLDGLADKSLVELLYLRDQIFDPKRQQNKQIAEMVVIDVSIDADAAPGDRELRLRTRTGLTSPLVFQVAALPETCEQEPNDSAPSPGWPEQPVLDLPILMNGQITPGDVDRFRFRARRGQQLVIEAHARRLIPYLADAVPGWFQAVLTLSDSDGRELAFADDYRFHPDPVLLYAVPEDGEYRLEICDSVYRGREDFVYRISIGEQPFITSMFPLGGPAGVETVAAIEGWNLPRKELALDTGLGPDRIRHTAAHADGSRSNLMAYAVGDLPECAEAEPNDTSADAQRIELPQIVNGRVDGPGDVDAYEFEGRAGDEFVAEVYGRRLDSPLDSLLRLTDAGGDVLDWNDDHMDKDGHLHTGPGLITHHADSYLRARLPEDGVYCVALVDVQNHGGEAYGYRLRISAPRPDFALRVTPSSLTILSGRAVPVEVHALRQDGFEGDIELRLMDAPAGFVLDGGRLPAGRDRIRMTLTAPQDAPDEPVSLRLEGRARIGEETVSRRAAPSDDVVQAFLWRHLAPAQELMVAVVSAGRFATGVSAAGDMPVRLPAGGSVVVRISGPRPRALQRLKLQLNGAPDGVALEDASVASGGLDLTLRADADALRVGYADNLIVEAFVEIEPKKKQAEDGAAKKKRRVSLGVLPAIPFEIVDR